MANNNKVAFSLEGYRFTRALLDFNISEGAKFELDFVPSGVYDPKKRQYLLSFDTIIKSIEQNKNVIEVSCEAVYEFKEEVDLDQIPEHFYPNSLAIIFPYIRAFVSTLSLQANIHPVVLPTVNMMGLTSDLKNATRIKE